ncbi:unnamed protein product, partial [Vitis vinifera]|uniref:Disease resistance protein n=1 Tax=Vitis vinifera TaxID=29760 RepID=D7TX59_VITVI
MVEIRKAWRAEALEYLEIHGCENLENLPNELQSFRSATELVIGECPKLMNILEKGWPPMLKKLRVDNCEGIKALLIIYYCENVKSLPEVVSYPPPLSTSCKGLKHHHLQNLTSLECLYISGCPSLESFPERGLGFAPNLRAVLIIDCENLKTPLEGLPATLGRLEIRRCPIIEKRCLKGRGEDWPHIAHIPALL